jgi:hypothetical protein
MASLTDQLNTDMNTKPVRQAPSPSTGLATALNSLAKGINIVDSSIRQNRQAERQAAEDAYKAKERARKEEGVLMPYLAEKAYREAQLDSQGRPVEVTTAVPSGPVPVDGDLQGNPVFNSQPSPLTGQIASDTNRAVTDLNNVQLAVSQRRMPAISFNSALNKRFLDLINKFPEQTDTIRKYFNDNGLNPSLARTALDEQSGHDAIREEGEKWGTDMFNKGAATLAPEMLATMTREQVIAQGAKATNVEYQLDLAKKQADLTLTNKNISEAERKAAEEIRDDTISQTTIVDAWNNSAPIMTALQEGMISIGKLPIAQQQVAFDQLAPKYDQWAGNYKAKAIASAAAAGQSTESLSALSTTIDTMIQRGRSLWSGDMSVAASNRRALESVTNSIKLSTAEAMPVYFALQQIGMKPDEIAGYSQAIAGNVELQTALQKEIKGFTGEFGKKNASTRLMEIVSILKGQKTLEDFSPEEARTMMPTLYKTSNNYTTMYARGQGDISTDTMLNGLGEMITAARTVSPATASTNTIKFATGGVARPDVRRALVKALKDPLHNDQAEATITGARAASAQIILSMRNSKVFGSYDTRFWKLQLDKDDGRAYAVPTGAKARVNPVLGDTGFLIGEVGSRFEQVPAKPPKELLTWAETYNANIVNISELNGIDPNGIKNATPLEVAKYYSLGVVPKSLQQEKQKAANPQKEIDNILGTIEDAFDNVPSMNSRVEIPKGSDPYNAVFGHGEFGRPEKPITKMTIGEAMEFGDTILKPATRAAGIGKIDGKTVGTSAIGAYQIVGTTMRQVAPEVFGENWKSVPMTIENQDKLGKYLFEKSKNGNLKRVWEGLPDTRPGAYADLSWNDMKRIIHRYESA